MEQTNRNACLLSVIVPVYNIEAYVGTCLRSLCMQGFRDGEYEVLCVNDGSTDASAQVVRQMAEQNPQIRLIEQENQGVSAARNKGLDEARGEYVLFCDGDDFFDLHCLQRAMALLLEQGAVSASFGFRTVEEGADIMACPAPKTDVAWYTGRKKPFYSGNVWRFLLKRDFLNQHNIRFKAGMRYAEDELFLYHVCRHLNFCQHIYITEVFYNYRSRPTSAVHQKRQGRLARHYGDMVAMAQEYKEILNGEALSRHLRTDTKRRMQYAVSNAMQDALLLGEREPSEVIDELKEKGLYPFGICVRLLKIKHPKTMLVNYSKLLYSIPLYYRLVYAIKHARRKG